VGRLRVAGSRFHDMNRIREGAPSLAEGSVPNFNDVQRELVALNGKNMRVTPEFRPGAAPNTVDVDLRVEDSFPLHGSVELNNRYSANTSRLRLDVSARYENLWLLDHTVGFGMQMAPERIDDALVFSGYYMAPVPAVRGLSVMLQGMKSDSNISTLGGSAVVGKGYSVGGKALYELSPRGSFFQTVGLGADYKSFAQNLHAVDDGGNKLGLIESPVHYVPVTASYTGLLLGKGYQTMFDASAVFSFRGVGSDAEEFDRRRYGADGSFFLVRGNVNATRDLPYGFQVFARVHGQGAATPLVDTEQFAVGGTNTVRGYLEAETMGDSAIAGTLELRSPSLLGWWKKDGSAGSSGGSGGSGKGRGNTAHELRVFAFLDGGAAWLNNPLPEQDSEFTLWSVGVGSSLKVFSHINAAFFLAFPQTSQSSSQAGHPFLSFRLWGEF